VISKSADSTPVGVPRSFHRVEKKSFERLTLTRFVSSRIRVLPFYRLRNIDTGFGSNAVVISYPTPVHR
jgi:hypothetical protein